MPAFRHVLRDNHWEIQCPVCHQFVPAGKPVWEGEEALPTHTKWAPSLAHIWMMRLPDRYHTRWVINLAGRIEWLVRKLTHKYEPLCDYDEHEVWAAYFPNSGLSPGGPLK